MRDSLRHIYANLFVEYVVRNPLYELKAPIHCELFQTGLQRYIRNLSYFWQFIEVQQGDLSFSNFK